MCIPRFHFIGNKTILKSFGAALDKRERSWVSFTNTDAQLEKAVRRETYVAEPPNCKTGGTVQLFSREGLET